VVGIEGQCRGASELGGDCYDIDNYMRATWDAKPCEMGSTVIARDRASRLVEEKVKRREVGHGQKQSGVIIDPGGPGGLTCAKSIHGWLACV